MQDSDRPDRLDEELMSHVLSAEHAPWPPPARLETINEEVASDLSEVHEIVRAYLLNAAPVENNSGSKKE